MIMLKKGQCTVTLYTPCKVKVRIFFVFANFFGWGIYTAKFISETCKV